MMTKRSTVNVDAIKEGFYVRQGLNDDHVLHLGALIEGGVKLPPIRCTEDGTVVDGRHRLAATKLLGLPSIEVEWTTETDRALLVVEAVKANLGGALPPSNGDITYAVRQMLDAGMPSAVVQKHFAKTWPPAVVRRYLSDAISALQQERIRRAKVAIVEQNLTVVDAATKFKIKLDTLKQALSSQRKRKTGASEFKACLTNIFRSRGASMGQTMRKAMKQMEDGDLSKAAVEDILEHLEKCANATTNSAKDWVTRMRAAKS